MQIVVNVAAICCGFRVSALAAVLGAASCVLAQSIPPADVPVDEWLQGSARQDFPWQVHVEPSLLTFQQRHLVQVRTAFPIGKLLKAGVSLPDLHFITKFGTEDGRWFPGQCYSRFVPPRGLSPRDQVASFASVYLRPGRYKVGVMAYDSLHRRGNLWKGELVVPREKDDPLPYMDADLPQIDYPLAIQPPSGGDANLPTLAHPGGFGEGKLRLPVSNPHPILVDVVANLSPSALTPERTYYHRNAIFLLQVSNVLSQLDFKSGCVRFSAIDILRQKTFAVGEIGPKVDWDKVVSTLQATEPNKIDAHALARQKIAPSLFAKFLQQVITKPSACGEDGQEPQHVLIVVSDAFLFPFKTEMTAVDAHALPNLRCYYLEMEPAVGFRFDEIANVLKPLHPERFSLVHPVHFRRTLAQIIATLGKSN